MQFYNIENQRKVDQVVAGYLQELEPIVVYRTFQTSSMGDMYGEYAGNVRTEIVQLPRTVYKSLQHQIMVIDDWRLPIA